MDFITEPVFSTRRAADLAGTTVHQLHTWASNEVAVPSIDPGYRQGRPKKWSFSDVVGSRILRDLIGAGICPPLLSNVLPQLRQFGLSRPGLAAMASASMVIFGNGDVAVAATHDEQSRILERSTGTILRALVIELAPAVADVEKAMRREKLFEDLELLHDLALVSAA